MTRNEFKIGDIVVLRNGDLGVYLESAGAEYILYQDGGFDFIDPNINEDLTSYDEPDFDIMQVYRSEYCAISFTDYDDDWDNLIYERDIAWERPSDEERAERRRIAREKYEADIKAYIDNAAEAKKDSLFIVAQGFYGNRTGTEIRRAGVKSFLKGFTSCQEISEPMDVKYIRVPGSDNLVIVYDQMQENEYLNVSFPEQLARSGADYHSTCKERKH